MDTMIRREAIYFPFLCLALCVADAGGEAPKKPAQPSLQVVSAQQIFKRVAPSVMVVESLDAKGSITTLGSGVVIGPGRVVTNRHVIEDGVSFKVEHDGKIWPAKLVRVDPEHDLAELSVAELNAPVVRIRSSSTLAVGEKVYAIGAPEGLELTISEGLISGLRDFGKDRVIQTSAATSPGSSGGGLFDAEGRLVGITTFYLKGGQSLNFALPGEWALALCQQPTIGPPPLRADSTSFQALTWFVIGYQAFQAGNYAAAAHAYEQTVRLDPDKAQPWIGLGIAYDDLGQYDKAVGAFQEAIRLKPEDEDAWLELGGTYGELGQYDKEKGAEQGAIRLKPNVEMAWYLLGSAYGELGQYDKAVSAEQEAIRLKPDDGDAWQNLGGAYAGLGQYDKAVSAEQEAIRLKPDDAKAWFAMGAAFKLDGQQAEVIKVYERLKTLDPKLAEQFFKETVLP